MATEMIKGKPLDGLIIPGGESTVQSKLMRGLNLFEPIREKIQNGLSRFELPQFVRTVQKRHVYGKELAADGLISHNPKYDKIEFTPNTSIYCYGRFLGVRHI